MMHARISRGGLLWPQTRCGLRCSGCKGESPRYTSNCPEPKKGKRNFIGVISDTHGLVRAEALRALKGSNLVVHAGDVGKPEVLATLRSIAPVIAVRGNNDRGKWARSLPKTATARVGAVRILVLHNISELKIDPLKAGYRVVISGHSHRPSVMEREGILFVNPGSAGPRRFKLPVAVARLRVKGSLVDAEIVELGV